MLKLIKSKKGLSPVVAAIILIAVTVAVSIAVAAWMGSMAISDMNVSELTITTLEFTDEGIVAHVANTGTSDVTIYRIRINGENVDGWHADDDLNTVQAGASKTFTSPIAVTEAAKYSVMLFSIDGTMVGSYTATA